MSVDPVTPGFLEALGAGLAEGRFFSSADTARSHRCCGSERGSRACVVAPGFGPRPGRALQWTQGRGRRRTGGCSSGSARDGSDADGLRSQQPGSGLLGQQPPHPNDGRSHGSRSGAARGDAHDRFRDQALVRINTLEETLDAAKAPRRFRMQLAGIFSILALGLAALGIYGVTAGLIVERVPEIGVRITCGATTLDVVSLVARHAATMRRPRHRARPRRRGRDQRRGVRTRVRRGSPTDPATYVVACASLTAADHCRLHRPRPPRSHHRPGGCTARGVT